MNLSIAESFNNFLNFFFLLIRKYNFLQISKLYLHTHKKSNILISKWNHKIRFYY